MRKWRLLALVALLACVVALAGCSDENQKAVMETVNQLEKNKPDVVWKYASEKSKNAYGEEGIKGRMQEVHNVLGVKSVDFKDLKLNKDKSSEKKRVYKAVLAMETDYGPIERPLTMTFVPDAKKEGRWLVDWKPSLILPGLNKDNGLKIESEPAKRGTIYDRNGNVLAKDENGARVYPYGVVAGPAVGYVRAATEAEVASSQANDINVPVGTAVGRAGFERVFNKKLSGKNGVTISLSDKPDDIIVSSKPKHGKDIRTTLDMRVQQAAYDKADGNYGAVVAMNPQNGQVLSLVSVPSYDPGNWLDQNMSVEDYEAAVADGLTPDDGVYTIKFTPGSTQKLFTSIVGLNEGVMTFDTYYNIYGEDWQPDNSWGGYYVHRVTPINGAIGLEQALISSDNIFFAMLGLNLGAEKLVQGLESLGYAQDVPGDLPVEKSQVHSTGTIDPEHQTGIADTSYGQYQVQITPYQLCMSYGLLANGGNIMEPKLLLDEEPKAWIPNVTSQENIDFLNKALRQATSITHPSGDRDYAAFTGKTGTAEVGPDGSINLGWYAGYDQDNPNCTMVVMINGVENRGGSDYNTMLFGLIMDELYADGQKYDPGEGVGIEKEKSEKDAKKDDKKNNKE